MRASDGLVEDESGSSCVICREKPILGRFWIRALTWDVTEKNCDANYVACRLRRIHQTFLTALRMSATNEIVKRLCVLWLLFCVVFSFPAAGGSAYMCLAETLWENIGTENCCDDCDDQSADPATCCYELDALPDGHAPDSTLVVPGIAVIELHGLQMAPPNRMVARAIRNACSQTVCSFTAAERRACLSVWRL